MIKRKLNSKVLYIQTDNFDTYIAYAAVLNYGHSSKIEYIGTIYNLKYNSTLRTNDKSPSSLLRFLPFFNQYINKKIDK